MGFLKKLWKSSTETPFNVESLNDLESRIKAGIDASTHNCLYKGVELTNFTWAQLSAKAKSGDFSGLNIGDYKTFKLGSETIKMQIAGMDTYWRTCDSQLGHHIDFISKDCMKTTYKMRSANTNNGTSAQNNPWLASELYTTLNTTIYNSLPTEIKNLIVTKRTLLESRYSASGTLTDSTGWAWGDAGKLWLPTEYEVFGSVVWGTKGFSGQQHVQYPIFANSWLNRIKGLGDGGGRCNWWLSTADSGFSTDFCLVNSNGLAHHNYASNSFGVPLCFRFA